MKIKLLLKVWDHLKEIVSSSISKIWPPIMALALLLGGLFVLIVRHLASPLGWVWDHLKEIVLLLAGLFVLFVWLPRVLQRYDATAGVLDPGTVQILLLGVIKYLAALLLGWGSGMRLLFRSFATYAESGSLGKDFAAGTNFPRVLLTVGLAAVTFLGALWAINSSF